MLELLATKRWREWAQAHECLAPWLFPTDNPAVFFMFLKSHQVIWSHRSLWIQDPRGQSCCCTLAQAPHGWGLPKLRLWNIKVLWHQIQTCRHIPFRSGSVVIYWITSSLINTKCILPGQTVQCFYACFRNSTTVVFRNQWGMNDQTS